MTSAPSCSLKPEKAIAFTLPSMLMRYPAQGRAFSMPCTADAACSASGEPSSNTAIHLHSARNGSAAAPIRGGFSMRSPVVKQGDSRTGPAAACSCPQKTAFTWTLQMRVPFPAERIHRIDSPEG